MSFESVLALLVVSAFLLLPFVLSLYHIVGFHMILGKLEINLIVYNANSLTRNDNLRLCCGETSSGQIGIECKGEANFCCRFGE